MQKKRLTAPFYTEERVGLKGFFEETTLPNNWLYAKGRYRTKITPDDLPEHYIYMTVFKVRGYITVEGVKDIKYSPNYRFNHLHKYDYLYISYDQPITSTTDERGHVDLHGYNAVLYGQSIVKFIREVRKRGSYDIEPIAKEVIKKEKHFADKYPEECVGFKDFLEELT